MLGVFRAVVLGGVLTLAGCARHQAVPQPERPVKVSMLEYVQPGDQLFEIINRGAKDAARALGVDLNIQYASMDPLMMNTLIDSAIARKVDGIAVTINNDVAYQGALCRAQKAGITVVAFNVDSSKGGADACRSAFFGQDLETAGYTLGKRLVATGRIKRGDLVFTPVEFADASYAVLRNRGIARALAEVGARTEIVGTGNNPPDVLDKMQQYLLGHRDAKAIITMGSVTGRMAVRAADGAGRPDILIATFDNSTEITDGIQSGRIVATADQQPYAQGFYAVTALALAARYGLAPSDVGTGSRGLTDKPSLAKVKNVSSLLGTYR